MPQAAFGAVSKRLSVPPSAAVVNTSMRSSACRVALMVTLGPGRRSRFSHSTAPSGVPSNLLVTEPSGQTVNSSRRPPAWLASTIANDECMPGHTLGSGTLNARRDKAKGLIIFDEDRRSSKEARIQFKSDPEDRSRSTLLQLRHCNQSR